MLKILTGMSKSDSFNEKQFIQKYLIDDIKVLLDKQLFYIALLIITQSIEFLGSYLDKKPIRARGQSKIRFNSALYYLFPGKYSSCNKGK